MPPFILLINALKDCLMEEAKDFLIRTLSESPVRKLEPQPNKLELEESLADNLEMEGSLAWLAIGFCLESPLVLYSVLSAP